MRTVVLTTAIGMSVIGLSTAADSHAAIRRTEIPAQLLRPALQQLSKDRDLQLVFRTDVVGDLRTAGATGELTLDEALTKLLSGTNLTFRYLDDKTITILQAPAFASPASSALPNATPAPNTTSEETTASKDQRSFWERFRLAQAPVGNAAVGGSQSSADPAPRATQIEEIIVTAQKREERLQDVPVPVASINAQKLAESNQLRVQEYYNTIPGLNLTLTGNGSEPMVSIRGVTTGGSNPTVAIVVDDIAYGSTVNPAVPPSVPDIDPGDLARVEVLRGPQGTLYGASSIGGLLKFVTIDPSTEELSGRIQTGMSSVKAGDDVGYSVRGALNIPIGDTFAVRASGFKALEPGYVDNARTGERDVDERESEGVRLSALWQPSENFSFKLSALSQQVDREGTTDVDISLGSGNLRQQSMRNTGQYDRKTEVYSATMTASLGNVEITSLTGYNIDEAFTRVDASPVFGFLANLFHGVDGSAIPFATETEKFSQELRAEIPLGDRVGWMVGLFYTDEDFTSTNTLEANDPSTGATVAEMLTSDLPTQFEERAVFTNLTFQLTERFDLQVGGRLSENEQSFYGVRRGPAAAVFFGSDPFRTPTVKADDNPVTYLVTPRFKVGPELMVYGRLASGYRPGGPNPACGITAADVPCDYGADTTENYEIGVKGGAADGLLTYDASVYYIDWKDIQLPFASATTGYTDNASRARSRGVELSVLLRPTDGLRISSWVAWNDAELTEDFPANSTSSGRDGDRLPFSSRFSGNFSIDGEFPLAASLIGLAGGSISYVGDREGTFRSATETRTKYGSYVQFDLNAGIRYDTWTLTVFANNLTDRRGVLRSGLDSISPNLITYVQPRTLGLSLAKTF